MPLLYRPPSHARIITHRRIVTCWVLDVYGWALLRVRDHHPTMALNNHVCMRYVTLLPPSLLQINLEPRAVRPLFRGLLLHIRRDGPMPVYDP